MPATAAAAPCLPLLPLFNTITLTPNPTDSATISRKLFHNDHLNYKLPPHHPMANSNSVSSRRRWRRRLSACYSSCSSNNSNITEFDLYELLGIDSSCDRSEIKRAYRNLQKLCHPDIAGAAGHDMAIILNEAYALLSNPNSRSAYDKEQAKFAELRGYSGKPIYSAWFGSESEERAVFVDEVKCVGCLKCALCADKTFAIESVYGRARVVGQWADPESKIQDAIQACPVDCISIVERSNLAALEFLMSKEPRGSVRIGMGNTAGMRVSNIFVEVQKFQTRFQEAKDKAAAAEATQTSAETQLQREARVSAIQAIRSISNWLYWKTPYPTTHAESMSLQNFTPIGDHKPKGNGPNIDKLREAAAARKHYSPNHNNNNRSTTSRSRRRAMPLNPVDEEDYYWMPSLPEAAEAANSSSKPSTSPSADDQLWKQQQQRNNGDNEKIKYQRKQLRKSNPIRLLAPMGLAILMAAVVAGGGFNLQRGEAPVPVTGGLKEHIYGSLALEIVNSSWLQILLVAITWYIIGILIIGLADTIKPRDT